MPGIRTAVREGRIQQPAPRRAEGIFLRQRADRDDEVGVYLLGFPGLLMIRGLHRDIVDPVDLSGSVYQFAEKLVRRENDLNRLRLLKK